MTEQHIAYLIIAVGFVWAFLIYRHNTKLFKNYRGQIGRAEFNRGYDWAKCTDLKYLTDIQPDLDPEIQFDRGILAFLNGEPNYEITQP